MKLPEIKGFIDVSLVDWDGKVSAVIFLPSCNFRCPFCYNTTLVLKPETLKTIPYEEIGKYLVRNKGWLDGVTITGGEPTIHDSLPNLCKQIKETGLQVKLDTNGTNSAATEELIAKELVDYIAMDLKAPLNRKKYSQAIGVNAENMLNDVKKTLAALFKSSMDYELRTTMVPTIHNKNDLEQMCMEIRDCKKYVLQNFKEDVELLDPKLRNVKPFSPTEMEEFLKQAKELVPNTFLR